MNFHRKAYLFLLILPFLFLGSCSPERMIARQFLREMPSQSIVVIRPDFLFLHNLSAEPMSDSSAIASAEFLGRIDEQQFLSAYSESFIAELRSRGLNVIDTLFPVDDSSAVVHIIDIAQLSFEEYIFEYRDEETFDTVAYYRDFDLRGISFNAWFDVSVLDGSTGDFITLFDSYEETDRIDGLFRMNLITGDVRYDYTLYEMQWPLVQSIPERAARLHAAMMVEYMVNRKVREMMPSDLNGPVLQFSYDAERDRLKAVSEPRTFQLVK